MFNRTSEIARFNERYLSALRQQIAADRQQAMQEFLVNHQQVLALSKFDDWSRLNNSDCTIIKQNFNCGQLRVPKSLPDGIEGQQSGIQVLNYEYLMLARHYAASSPREAMLRTGVSYETAMLLKNYSAYDLQVLTAQHPGIMGVCHLSAKAITATLSHQHSSMAELVTIFSMRGCLCPH